MDWGCGDCRPLVVAQISNGAQALLSLTQGTDGRWTGEYTTMGERRTREELPSTSVGTHVSVSVQTQENFLCM